MDKIQKVLIKAGRKDLAQKYYLKIAEQPLPDKKHPELRYRIILDRIEKKLNDIGDHITGILEIKNRIRELIVLLRSEAHPDAEKLKEVSKIVNEEIGDHIVGIRPIKSELNNLLKEAENIQKTLKASLSQKLFRIAKQIEAQAGFENAKTIRLTMPYIGDRNAATKAKAKLDNVGVDHDVEATLSIIKNNVLLVDYMIDEKHVRHGYLIEGSPVNILGKATFMPKWKE